LFAAVIDELSHVFNQRGSPSRDDVLASGELKRVDRYSP